MMGAVLSEKQFLPFAVELQNSTGEQNCTICKTLATYEDINIIS